MDRYKTGIVILKQCEFCNTSLSNSMHDSDYVYLKKNT